MRAENQAQAQIVTSINTIVTTISHQTTVPTAMRGSITHGVQKGIYESTFVKVASE